MYVCMYVDIIKQSLQSRYLRLITGNLTKTLSMLQAAEKRFHSIPKIGMAVCKKMGLVPCSPRFDSG